MPDSDRAIPAEGSIVTALDMLYVHIPVPFDAPDVEHLVAFIRVMNAFSSRRVWVHCVLNYRVSAFLYQYYRLVLGASPADARRVMLSSWQPNDVWTRFIALSKDDIHL